MKPIIDISAWQPPTHINYDRLANEVSGVILRVAYGTRADIHFATHYRELRARGVPIGAYHYIVEYKTVTEQITTAMTALGDRKLQLGFWVDVELEPNATPLRAVTAVAYTREIETRLGYKAGIYTSASMWRSIFGSSNPLSDRDLWVAYYTTGNTPILPTGWSTWKLWQHTSNGRLDGYAGDLDVNRYNGTQADFDAWAGNESEPIDPPTDPEPDPPTQPKAYKATVTANVLNVRKAPQDIVVGSLKRGAEVEVLDEQDAWRKLGHQLWVSGEWLKRIANAPDPQPQPDLVPYVLWGQRDARWASDRMGASNITLGQQGCLVTAVASVMASYGIDTDPKRYNGRLSSEGGYLAPNLMYWQMPRIFWGVKLTEYELFAGGTGWQRSVDTILSSRRPVLAMVDMIPGGAFNQHWVTIVGKRGNDYIITDPWTADLVPLTRYENKIYRLAGYSRD